MKDYIDSLKIEDIPWDRMTAIYGTAEKFPEYLAVLEKMQNIDSMYDALWGGIMQETDHQETLSQPLPFVVIFLKRLLQKAENTDTPQAEWLAENIKKYFDIIVDACDFNTYEYSHGDHLRNFQDLLDEKYFPPNYYYLESAGEIDPLDYEFSIIYYTKRIIEENKKYINLEVN